MAYIRTVWNYKSATWRCVQNGFWYDLWSISAGRSALTYAKWSFFNIFSRLGTFTQVFGKVKAWLRLEQHKIIRASHLVACSIVFILFYERSWQGGVLRHMKIDHFYSIFSRLGPFPQDFGLVKEWTMLKLHNIISVSHAVACPVVFILFYERSWQGRAFKVMKTGHFLVFLTVWVLFLKFLGRLRSSLS